MARPGRELINRRRRARRRKTVRPLVVAGALMGASLAGFADCAATCSPPHGRAPAGLACAALSVTANPFAAMAWLGTAGLVPLAAAAIGAAVLCWARGCRRVVWSSTVVAGALAAGAGAYCAIGGAAALADTWRATRYPPGTLPAQAEGVFLGLALLVGGWLAVTVRPVPRRRLTPLEVAAPPA